MKELGRMVQFYASVTGAEPWTIEEGFVTLRAGPSQL